MKRARKDIALILLIILVNLTGCEAFVVSLPHQRKIKRRKRWSVPEEWTGPKMSKKSSTGSI